ncbi:hypothetical protein DWF00_02695 [Bosea caraganae]|uniref:OmpA-like domain-containing protein n=1 Tax=Bosea caraganae TaxID=2763117 RepID=A0A370L2L4_9HYPH|nr:OmpA family protein [Bosea caraganae]RDJ22503.1 hypothetical protein DWE98_18860 [Bosea caraganae]RDJ30462.1 hypothetical protein DWF00_02695 [Bosea caraganae]
MNKIAIALIAIAASWLSLPASAQDHPLLGRFEGAKQVGYKVSTFDEANIITGPIDEKRSRQQSGPGWETVEGKVFTLYYKLPPGRTGLEALRNYQQALTAQGFEVPFTCSTASGNCFTDGQKYPGLFLGLALDGATDLPKLELGDFVRNFFGDGAGRYLYAKLNRPGGTVHVSLAFSEQESRGRTVIARVIETGKMETGKIQVVDASQLGKEIDQTGKATVYGILFDFNKADIKPESQPQLKQIADLLAKAPSLQLNVVGHTDNQGGGPYNLKLSDSRAFSVVAELVTRYGIDRSRLTPSGKGLEQPVASNADEAGRALNRRVELIRR